MMESPAEHPWPEDRAEASDVALTQLLQDGQGFEDPHTAELRRVLEFHRSMRTATPRVFVTKAIVAVNVAVFVAMAALGISATSPTTTDMIAWGANYGPMTTGGQWWRLLTCMFLHFGVIHLGFNMYVLWSAGPFVERLLGNAGFLALYLVSGLAGSLTSVYWHPDLVSAGASGAVFGVFGGLLGYLARCPDSVPKHALAALRKSVVTFVGYNLFFGLMVPQIDLMAHAGGFVGGLLCALVISRRLTPEGVAGRLFANGAGAVAGVALIAMGIWLMPPGSDDLIGAVERFSIAEKASLQVFNAAVEQLRQGRITEDQLADTIERDVLPEWSKGSEPVLAMKRVPASRSEFVTALRRYIVARQQSWQLLVDGIREGDPQKTVESRRQAQAASALLDKLNE